MLILLGAERPAMLLLLRTYLYMGVGAPADLILKGQGQTETAEGALKKTDLPLACQRSYIVHRT